ncbi:MAG: hypothetical protein DLM70_01855, partial [Chloroflexi bacterium]
MSEFSSDESWIAENYVGQLSNQSYDAPNPIDGVEFLDPRLANDEGGDFCEIARLVGDGAIDGLDGFRVAQVNCSLVLPGTIKAWHVHRNQQDVWFVPPSHRLLVG